MLHLQTARRPVRRTGSTAVGLMTPKAYACSLCVYALVPQRVHACPQDTGFFRGWGGAWDSNYGRFFMKWYSDQLLLHGERLCKIAVSIFNTSRPQRCTSRYHSMHPSSPLNPMSLVSDLASVLRCPDQPAALLQPTQGLTELQSMPLHEHSTGQGGAAPAGLEAAYRPADEPLTPASESAPNPSSWPKAQLELAQGPAEARQEQLQLSSLQPSEPTQLPTASQSAASGSRGPAEAAASQSLVAAESASDVAAVLRKHPEVSRAGQPDSLQMVPPESTIMSSTDEAEAPTKKQPAPNRCIPCIMFCQL